MHNSIKNYLLYSALFSAFLSSLTALAQLPACAHQNEWRLEQIGDNKQKCIVTVAEKAVRMDISNMGCAIICKAPDWQVHCFRDDEKNEWIGSMELVSTKQLVNPYSVAVPSPKHIPFKVDAKRETTICGLPATRYRSYNSIYTCADEIAVDPMIVKLMHRMHGCPYLPSVPVVICTTKRGGQFERSKETNWIDTNSMSDLRKGQITSLDTIKITKMPYRAKDFALPKGYARKKDLVEVSFSQGQRVQIGDFLDNAGFEGNVEKIEKLDREKRKAKKNGK